MNAMIEGGTLLLRVAKRFRSELDTQLQNSGVSSCEFFLLHILAKHGGMSQGALSDHTTIDRTSLVSILDALEQRAWLTRNPMPEDRRANLVELTPEGQKVHQRSFQYFQDFEKQFLGCLDEKETHQLMDILRRLV